MSVRDCDMLCLGHVKPVEGDGWDLFPRLSFDHQMLCAFVNFCALYYQIIWSLGFQYDFKHTGKTAHSAQ